MARKTAAGADGWRIVDAQGKTLRRLAVPPGPLPFSVVPGTLVSFTLGEWLMLVDVQFFWEPTVGEWRQGGTLMPLPDPMPGEADLHALRHSLLRQYGWV